MVTKKAIGDCRNVQWKKSNQSAFKRFQRDLSLVKEERQKCPNVEISSFYLMPALFSVGTQTADWFYRISEMFLDAIGFLDKKSFTFLFDTFSVEKNSVGENNQLNLRKMINRSLW